MVADPAQSPVKLPLPFVNGVERGARQPARLDRLQTLASAAIAARFSLATMAYAASAAVVSGSTAVMRIPSAVLVTNTSS